MVLLNNKITSISTSQELRKTKHRKRINHLVKGSQWQKRVIRRDKKYYLLHHLKINQLPGMIRTSLRQWQETWTTRMEKNKRISKMGSKVRCSISRNKVRRVSQVEFICSSLHLRNHLKMQRNKALQLKQLITIIMLRIST